ncbi:hypothetical protein BaRGS_00034177, partial [Batillaria attramentaria]
MKICSWRSTLRRRLIVAAVALLIVVLLKTPTLLFHRDYRSDPEKADTGREGNMCLSPKGLSGHQAPLVSPQDLGPEDGTPRHKLNDAGKLDNRASSVSQETDT